MTITIQSIPQGLKTDKSVSPYIIRSLELEQVNPIVSYYCKIYVLEYILNNKVHLESKENETFTIELLDDTEKIKNNKEDEDIHKVLQSKQLSIVAVLSFSYKLFNQCLQDLNDVTRETKPQLIKKIQACLNFLNVLQVFQNSDEIEWAKISKVDTWDQFDKLNKDKIKVLKYQLSRLIKDEVSYKNSNDVDDEQLEKELDQELENLSVKESEEKDSRNDNEDIGIDLPGAPNDLPKFIDESSQEESEEAPPVLPGAPHFSPQVSDEEDGNFKLPGAPRYLPSDDDELSHINKTSSIHVYQPSSKKEDQPADSKPNLSRNTSHHQQQHHHQLSKNDIKQILDKEDSINVIKKNIKFANSALTFDDLNECERQLEDAIKLIKALKSQEESS